MAEFHFVADYEKFVANLIATHPLDEAMSLAVGGSYDGIGGLERDMVVWAGLKSGMSLLDFGCGSGRLAHALGKSLRIQYHGLDVVQSLLDYAATKSPRHYRFSLNASMRLPVEDASIDFVAVFSVFTHLLPSEVYIYLEEMRRVLKPGGTVLCTFLEVTEHAHWAPFLTEVAARRESAAVPLNTLLERPFIERMCQDIGFSVVQFVGGSANPWGSVALGQSTAVLRRPF